MYDDNLIDAISRIDDKYINEYMSRKLAAYGGNKKKRTRPFVKWLAVAAACVVVVGIAFVIASIAKKESLSKMTAYSGVHLFTDGQDLYFTSPDMKLMKYCIDDGSLEPVKDETSEWYYTL